MTYNLKSKNNAVVMGSFHSSTRVTVSSGSTPSNATYAFNSQVIGTGMQATISAGNVLLGDRIYHGFFYPMASGGDEFSMSVFINGVSLSTQASASKAAQSSVGSSITRGLPIFFSYNASAGDILSIRYSKVGISEQMLLYENSIGGNVLFLLEVTK